MSELPFGFGPADRDPSRGGSGPGGPGGPGGPFDVNALGQMLTQLGQMLSHASATSGPVNYDLAKQLAMQQLSANGGSVDPTAAQQSAVSDALRLAEVWLDAATTLPAGITSVQAWSPWQWVENTLPTWQRLCDPVARQFAGAWTNAMPEEMRQAAGPLLAMVSQMGGLAFGSQLGGALAQLGNEVLTSSDIGLPLGAQGTGALLPRAIEAFTEGLDRPASEVLVFLAAREAAHQRLFAHVPWLRGSLLGTVEQFAQGITVDTEALEKLAREVDPSNPAALEEAMGSGVLEPRTSPEQRAALSRLETMLALVEGWVDVVVADAVGSRLPGADALRETLRRRRATGGPAEQTFATLVGLELRPRQLRAASTLWRALTDARGADGRDALWAHPDLMPTAEDLDDPTAFVDRSASSLDPMAELERTEREEAESAGGTAPDAEPGSPAGDGPAAEAPAGPEAQPDPEARAVDPGQQPEAGAPEDGDPRS
ncbi:MAG TPA: zinc-dependent metalloprotease [Pseudonocardiaceae bacterium]